MSLITGTAVVQVTNLSSAVSSEQLRTLFGFLGDIEELRLYPPDNAPLSFSSKVCYIKYREPSSVGVAQHLTNTVFIDRALIVVPCAEGKIPEEAKALSLLAPTTPVPNLIPGGGLLPIPTPAPIQNLNLPIVNQASPALDPSASLSAQPPLMGNVDPSKIDEIRRTVYVGNLNSQTTTAEQLLEFFQQVGDVKYVRMAGDETQPTRFAFVEFVDQQSVSRALTFNGVMFRDRPLKINHSNNAIVKPPELTPQAAAKELESVMKRVREAQCTIAAAIEPADGEKHSSSRSRRSHRSRSHSHSRTHRKRSHSRHRSRPSQKWPKASDSRSSRSSQRRHSRERRHSRSHSKGHKRRSGDGSRSPRRRPRSPSPKKGRKDKRRERSRERKDRSTSRKRSHENEDKMRRKARVERDCDREEKEDSESDREDSATPSEDMTSPFCAQHNGSYKTCTDESVSMDADSTK
ncbi:splicing regulatory glutamine/lysine-rich protein 1 isoform X2 [Lampris incognitus]|uniref:splicing regulatory glutamine/lysine-rich protein 1 isoform X2 n=1 Tax=Lampris incognitus TaxID=2546036 RepID=UPI0024B4F401|nr:splicing regulatory glutamine/lysine-rich protein 1 isoform X2 [Lampris incognitus]